MSDQKIGSRDRPGQILVTLAHCRKDNFLSQELWTSLRFHDLFDQFLILFLRLRYVWSDRDKLQAGAFYFFTVDFHRCNDGHVTTRLQFHGDRHVWMNVT